MRNPLSDFWESYLRWRHFKGYGVHSPFAYRLVTEVINPGDYGYYGYVGIHRACNKINGDEARMRLLLRLMVQLQKRRIVLNRQPDDVYRAVAKSVSASCIGLKGTGIFKFQPGDLLVIEREVSGETINEAIEKETPVIAYDPAPVLRKIMETPINRGLLLQGKKTIILIPRKEMAYTSYIMKMP